MESQDQAIKRLLTVLERLADQEALFVASGDHAGVVRTQQKATPVVERLATLGAGVVDARAHARVATLLEKRQRSQQALAAQMAQVREELLRTRASQNRLSSIAPLYVGLAKRGVARRLCAVS
jgi:urocanate hydratase